MKMVSFLLMTALFFTSGGASFAGGTKEGTENFPMMGQYRQSSTGLGILVLDNRRIQTLGLWYHCPNELLGNGNHYHTTCFGTGELGCEFPFPVLIDYDATMETLYFEAHSPKWVSANCQEFKGEVVDYHDFRWIWKL